MAHSELLFRDEARAKVLAGATRLADAVRVTLGPKVSDLVEHGIIDPTKVVRVALENAASVAGTLLLSDATLTEVPDEEELARRGEPALAET